MKWFGSNTGIQSIKEAEAAVRDSEERLRFALEASHAGAWDRRCVGLFARRQPRLPHESL